MKAEEHLGRNFMAKFRKDRPVEPRRPRLGDTRPSG